MDRDAGPRRRLVEPRRNFPAALLGVRALGAGARPAALLELGEALGERPLGLRRRPCLELEVERLDPVELGPVPALGAEGAALRGEQRAVGALDRGDAGADPEARADRLLEVVLGGLEGGAERAAVLDRMRHVAEV